MRLDQAVTTLKDLPEKPKEQLLLREAMEQLLDDVQAAFSKGYTHEEVAAILSQQGVEMTAPSLKYYVSRLNKQKNATTGAKPKRTRSAGTTSRRKAAFAADDGADEAAEPAAMKVEASKVEAATSIASDSESAPKETRTRSKAPAANSGTKSKSAAKPKATASRSKSAAKPRSTSKTSTVRNRKSS